MAMFETGDHVWRNPTGADMSQYISDTRNWLMKNDIQVGDVFEIKHEPFDYQYWPGIFLYKTAQKLFKKNQPNPCGVFVKFVEHRANKFNGYYPIKAEDSCGIKLQLIDSNGKLTDQFVTVPYFVLKLEYKKTTRFFDIFRDYKKYTSKETILEIVREILNFNHILETMRNIDSKFCILLTKDNEFKFDRFRADCQDTVLYTATIKEYVNLIFNQVLR